MARRDGFRLRGVYAAVENLTQVAAREAALKVSRELALISPFYSGDFADNWVVRVGNVPIPAETSARQPRPSTRQTRREPTFPTVPSLKGALKAFGENAYSIGNTMEYRDIAMDLVPGRTERAGVLSAPQDWYINYLNNPNGLRARINSVLDSKVVNSSFVVQRPRDRFIGPIGRFRR